MKTKISLAVLVIFAIMVVGGSVYAGDEITAYMGTSPDNNIAIVNYVKAKTGIDIKQTFQSFGEIEAKVKAEAPNFNADMVLGCGSPLCFMAAEKKWAQSYKSPKWQGISNVFADPKGYWYNIGNFSFVLVGNKDILAKKGLKLPTSWKELLDPKWKGEIVMASPLSSGTANMIRFTFLALYGDDGGWDFLKKLDKNIHHYTRSGNAPTDLVGRGEFTLGITSDENVKNRLDQGYPIVWGVPEEGIGYDGTFAFIFSTTEGKQLSLCKKVIDALAEQEFSAVMANIGYMAPRPAPNKLYGEIQPKYIDLDLGKAAKERPKNNDIWKSKFRTTYK